MADAARLTMTPEDFFVWQRDQDELYELVDGYPVPRHRMMTGASMQHDRATVNIIISLGTQLRGTSCRPTTADIALRTSIRGLRRPDVMVECAPLVQDTYEAREPKLVVEVASPSTTTIDQTRKVEEYKRHPTLAYILLVETLKPQALLYRRLGEGWDIETFEGLDAVIGLPAIGATLAMADIYDGLSFPPRRDLASEA
ncbi:Uma2 family endonuclease [Methylobacterium sp. J-078]|uniref:Uma2 family endonuclease n=1 Tax=Methylobacterium sp. J-078 TaxID=2836657 RepID=UPI001FBA5AB6|nr:Uma2 family endonuclease [Methylobacterium sp. J-078]MCJ2043831.1 Uma2 family endonuclease [Methylobacterium sp. J-078]